MSAEEYWSKIKEHFLKINEVQKQGESLKIRKKMFIMLNKGNFVLKLPYFYSIGPEKGFSMLRRCASKNQPDL